MHHCPNCGISLKKYESVTIGNVTINESFDILYAGQRVNLYPSSRIIFDALIRNAGRVLSRETLVAISGLEDSSDRTIDQYVGRGRRAFEKIDPNFDCVVAVRGLGYVWQEKQAARLAA